MRFSLFLCQAYCSNVRFEMIEVAKHWIVFRNEVLFEMKTADIKNMIKMSARLLSHFIFFHEICLKPNFKL